MRRSRSACLARAPSPRLGRCSTLPTRQACNGNVRAPSRPYSPRARRTTRGAPYALRPAALAPWDRARSRQPVQPPSCSPTRPPRPSAHGHPRVTSAPVGGGQPRAASGPAAGGLWPLRPATRGPVPVVAGCSRGSPAWPGACDGWRRPAAPWLERQRRRPHGRGGPRRSDISRRETVRS